MVEREEADAMEDFTLQDYRAIKEKLTQENGREPEQLELAMACYELGYTRAESGSKAD